LVDRWLQFPRVALAVRLAALWLGALSHVVALKLTERACVAIVREIVERLADVDEVDHHDDDAAEQRTPLSADVPRLPLLPFGELVTLADTETAGDSAVDRRNRRLYELLARRSSTAQPAVDPLTSPEACAVQRQAVGALFTRLFDIRLDARALDAVSGYGHASTALSDFLTYCGYPSRMPIGRIREADVYAFVLFAEWRHQQFRISGPHAAAAFRSLTGSWRHAKALYQARRAQREVAALQHKWLHARAAAYRHSVRQQLERLLELDAALQASVADRLTFDLHMHALACLTQAAATAFERSRSTAEANRHAETLTAGLNRLRLVLTEALHRNDRVRL
jgi:hypothetical protein